MHVTVYSYIENQHIFSNKDVQYNILCGFKNVVFDENVEK